MNKKRLVISLLMFAMIVATACGAGNNGTTEENGAPDADQNGDEAEQGAGEVVQIDIATVYEEKAAPSKGAQRFADILNESGQFEVNFFPNGALGSERENFEAVRAGDLQMVLGGFQGPDMFAPEYMFFTAPFLFKSMEHMETALNGDLGQGMFDAMADENIQHIGTNIRGERHMTANKRVETPEDVKGLNLRLPEIEAWIASWDAIGASPTPVALPELYGALQTGVVDASEGPYEQIATYNLQEVQDYLINTAHAYEATFLWMNGDLWESLSPEQQALIEEASAEAMEYADAEALSDAEQFYQDLQDAGMEVIDPDIDAFVEKAQPGLERFFEESWTVTSLEEINSLAE